MTMKMYDGGKIVVGLVIFLILLLFPVWYQLLGEPSKAPEVLLSETAREAQNCVEEKTYMTIQHMKILDRWRNEAVRDADRYYAGSDEKIFYKSLQVTCLECHANKTQFCDQCHNYMGVDPYCWDCHVAPKEN